jgi:hypothetical protein
MHLGPKDVLVNISIDFREGISSGDVETAISNLERAVKTAYTDVTRVFIEAQGWASHLRSMEELSATEVPKLPEENQGKE